MEYAPLVDLYLSFVQATKKVKWSFPNAFILGGPHERSLKYYLESAIDTMYYLRSSHKLIEARFLGISLFDSESIDRFDRVLKLSKQFEDLQNEMLMFKQIFMVQRSDDHCVHNDHGHHNDPDVHKDSDLSEAPHVVNNIILSDSTVPT